MKKNTQRIGIPAGLCAALIFVLTLAACPAGGVGYIPPTPQTVEYQSVDAEGNSYRLVITETLSAAKYAVKQDDKYVLTIVFISGETKTSSGTVAGANTAITLSPSNGSGTITVTISGGQLTGITIPDSVKDDNSKTLSTANGPITLEPLTAAEYLAAKINAVKPESAAAEGDVVTLSGSLKLDNSLTVPAGVTLDVTASGTALGLGNATLTVNGTVNTGSKAIRLEDGAATAAINGSGTIYLKGRGALLDVQGNRKLTIDGVTLVGVNNNNEVLVRVGSGGELVLKSGKISGNTVQGADVNGGGVFVNDSGKFTMKGGAISGNTAQGVNWAKAKGGGVFVDNGGTFTMESGTISGNIAQGDDWAGGGGVFVNDSGTFTMESGAISDNIAQSANWASGGGVEVWEGIFTMEGGTISGNTAQGVNGANAGGVFVDDGGQFTMKDGGISGNIAQGNNVSGGGVFVNNSGKFTMNSPAVAGASGSIKGNTCSGAVSNVYNGGTVNGSANPNPLNITNGLLW